MTIDTDVLIVGSGAAGLTAALNLAETCRVAVIAKVEAVHTLITDDKASPEVVATLQARGVEVILA